MKTIKIDASNLVGEYKILSNKAIQQIKDIVKKAQEEKEETLVELPEGLLCLNFMNEDFKELNDEFNYDSPVYVTIKIPSTIIAYSRDIWKTDINFCQFLVPSFFKKFVQCYRIGEKGKEYTLEEESIFGLACSYDDFYECEVPKRRFTISGRAHSGQEYRIKTFHKSEDSLFYDKLQHKIKRNILDPEIQEYFQNNSDEVISFIYTGGEVDYKTVWTLEIENLEIDLFCEDTDSDVGIYFEIDESKVMTLITGEYL